jgi:hypothetical protein
VRYCPVKSIGRIWSWLWLRAIKSVTTKSSLVFEDAEKA